MNRQQVIDDIKETLGKVPESLKTLPDDTPENECGTLKRFEAKETSIPPSTLN